MVSLWGAATASSCQSGISTRLSYLQKRASRAIVNRTSPAVVEKGEGRIPDLAEQLHRTRAFFKRAASVWSVVGGDGGEEETLRDGRDARIGRD